LTASYRDQVLMKIKELCGAHGSAAASDVVEELQHIPRSTVFALIGRLKDAGEIDAELFKQPRGADLRRVTVYRPKVELLTPAQELESELRHLAVVAARIQDLARKVAVASGGPQHAR
jgi:hypothetical protein